jgi:mannose-6-phosphate isomerase-like protein (cupin superfamily)
MVSAGKAKVLDGTFTVHAGHALMFESGSHQYSIFEGQTTEVPLEDAQGCARLGDGMHKLTFVGAAKPEYRPESDHRVHQESGKYYQVMSMSR